MGPHILQLHKQLSNKTKTAPATCLHFTFHLKWTPVTAVKADNKTDINCGTHILNLLIYVQKLNCISSIFSKHMVQTEGTHLFVQAALWKQGFGFEDFANHFKEDDREEKLTEKTLNCVCLRLCTCVSFCVYVKIFWTHPPLLCWPAFGHSVAEHC